jgi:hypothetical protein
MASIGCNSIVTPYVSGKRQGLLPAFAHADD